MIIFLIAATILGLGVVISVLWPLRQASMVGTLIPLTSIIIGLTGVFYWQWGEGPGLAYWYQDGQRQYQLRQQVASLGGIQGIAERLMQRIKQTPNDPRGWYLLGRLYYSEQQFAKAAGAFAIAYDLNPEDANTALQYAQSLFFAGNKQDIIQAEKLAKKAIKLNSYFSDAYNLLALISYSNGNYSQALNYWQTILSYLPENDPQRNEYLEAIKKTKALL